MHWSERGFEKEKWAKIFNEKEKKKRRIQRRDEREKNLVKKKKKLKIVLNILAEFFYILYL